MNLMNIFISPFVNALFGLYYLMGNLGWAIVIITVLIRLVLVPLVVPSLKSAKRMRDLLPKLEKLKEKYGKEKQELAKAQMELYKQEGINPLSGCLPQIVQIAVLLIFFAAFNIVTGFSTEKVSFDQVNSHLIESFKINRDFKFHLDFLGNNLTEVPSKLFKEGISVKLILPLFVLLGSGVLQYWSAKLMMPAPKVDEKIVEKTKDKEDDMMSAMRTQSLYMMPLMTIFIGWNFSLGLLLYWFVNSAFMIGQQLVMNRLDKK